MMGKYAFSESEWVADPGYSLDGFVQAAGYSTAPYKPKGVDPRRCAAKGCKGFHTKTSKLCAGHSRSKNVEVVDS